MAPDYLSASRIQTYLLCPRKYRYRYIDKLEPERRSVDLILGSAVHSAIAWWLERHIDDATPAVAAAQRIYAADWLADTVVEGVDYRKKDPIEARQLGADLVELFIGWAVERQKPSRAEHRFEVGLPDLNGGTLPIPLVGYIDFVGDQAIGEVKTTARKNKPSNWWLQLAAYSYGFREVTGVRPRICLVQLVKTKEPKLEVSGLTLTDREEAWFLEVAGEVLNGILAGAFFPNPSWMCATCEYRRACRGG